MQNSNAFVVRSVCLRNTIEESQHKEDVNQSENRKRPCKKWIERLNNPTARLSGLRLELRGKEIIRVDYTRIVREEANDAY